MVNNLILLISPLTLIAFLMLMRLALTVMSSRLKRTISCTRTVFMLCLYDVGYFRSAASVSKLLGSLDKMSAATSSTTSSVDLPPFAEALACKKVKNDEDIFLFSNTISLHLKENNDTSNT